MSFKSWLGNLWAGTKRNSPIILTTLGIGMFAVSVGEAVRNTPKAMEAIEEKKKEEGHEQLTMVQTIQATWRFYIWSATAFFAGVFCEASALKENNKRIAGLMAVAESGRNLVREFNDYRRFVAERVGPKKEAEIYNQAAQEVVDRNPPPADMADRELIDGQAPKPVCYEIDFERYFYVDYETVYAAVNKLNNEINNGINGYVSLNDFYSEIHVKTTKYGDMLGWSTETGLIEIPDKNVLRYAGTPNGWPCWILEFVNPPQYEYQFFRKH